MRRTRLFVMLAALGISMATTTPPTVAEPGNNADFPATDSNYHNYAETVAEIKRLVAREPSLASAQVIGGSYQGREIWAVKLSDNPTVDENEPEVLLTFHQHAREHLTVEMALYIMNSMVDNYVFDPTVQEMLNGREIWLIPDMNPDGGEYDIDNGSYRGWRKNMQVIEFHHPTWGYGVDLNRNWPYQWGCCGHSSTDPMREDYRGPGAEYATEVQVVKGFVDRRVVGGKQQIAAAIDFHTFGERVMWPFGYTGQHVVPGVMSQAEYDTFAELGRRMVWGTGYSAMQTYDFQPADGTITDWLWGMHRVYAFTMEMYPASGGMAGFYPPDEVIVPETERAFTAVWRLMRNADCPPQVIGGTCR